MFHIKEDHLPANALLGNPNFSFGQFHEFVAFDSRFRRQSGVFADLGHKIG